MSSTPRVLQLRLVLAAAVTLAVYTYFRLNPAHDPVWRAPTFHFITVSTVVTMAAIVSAIFGWAGIRSRNVHVLTMALALISLMGFFMIHGLSTPGFILSESYSITGVASQVAMTTCSVWMLLSTVSSDRLVLRIIAKHSRGVLFGWLGLILVANAVALLHPEVGDWIPVDSNPLKGVFMVITMALYLWTGHRIFQRYRFARLPIQHAATLGVVLLAITQLVMVTTMMWSAAWWFYHFLLLVVWILILYGIVVQYKVTGSLMKTIQLPFSTDPVERIRMGISPSIQSLIVVTETKDSYTAGHNFRVAMYAIQIADFMDIAPEQVRALAQAGVIHDVGKIDIPGEILNKPGALTPEERSVIERHPVIGYDMCKRIGFMQEELDVIRHHHEKWDGTGYPDGLKGAQISLLARILAVADVYDALTSRRSYREPWTHERAFDMIMQGSGTHFDPACVTAWAALCKSDRLVIPPWNEYA